MTEGRHLFLVGFMGAGKSTVGRIVAEKTGLPFVDLDAVIESSAERKISAIFEESGESAFRDAETEALRSTAEMPPSVIACGGGIVVRDENRALLKQLGTTMYLEVTAGEAVGRIGDGGTRPLLAGPGGVLAATTLLTARESLYRSVADVTIDTGGRTARQVAAMVVEAYEGGQS